MGWSTQFSCSRIFWRISRVIIWNHYNNDYQVKIKLTINNLYVQLNCILSFKTRRMYVENGTVFKHQGNLTFLCISQVLVVLANSELQQVKYLEISCKQ